MTLTSVVFANLMTKVSAMPSSKAAKLFARVHNFGDDGQSMIEMAVVLPVLLMVVTGILTFGVAFNNYIQLTEATSVGARTLAISRSETTDPCATAATAIYAAAPSLIRGSLTFTFTLNGTAYSGTSCSSSSNTTGAAGNLVQGSNATVMVSYPCSLKVYGTNYAPSCTLHTQMTEYVQ
jgi:Flp pilus assembly protein TadG